MAAAGGDGCYSTCHIRNLGMMQEKALASTGVMDAFGSFLASAVTLSGRGSIETEQ